MSIAIIEQSSRRESDAAPVAWPVKHNVFGVQLSATTYEETVDKLLEAAKLRLPAIASFHAAHAVVTASNDAELKRRVNSFEIVAPDGQPVRWALNLLHRARLRERVYGPEIMLRLCRRAAAEGVSIYLYGGASDAILDDLMKNLCEQFPALQIAGAESPPFRPLTAEEDEAVIQRINRSGAGLVFIGLGCPKQDHFAYEHRPRLRAVQACVGAAFDFHAGRTAMAPAWMQRNGLEWLFRLCSEPRRLWRRYLVTNTLFLQKLLSQWSKAALAALIRPFRRGAAAPAAS